MKEIIYIRSINPEFDSRLNKFISSCKKNNVKYKVLYWNRKGESSEYLSEKYIFSYNMTGHIGNKWRNIFNLLGWEIYIFFFLLRNYKNDFAIHAVDLDCVFPAWLYSKLFRKKIIFDVYDCYADAKNTKGLLNAFLKKVEVFFIKKSDLCILVDEIRYKQHSIGKRHNVIVIENVPDVNSLHISKSELGYNSKSNKIVLGYFGSLEPNYRGIEDLVNAVIKNNNAILKVAGYGPLSLYLERKALKHPEKIIYLGKLSHSEGLKEMASVDVYVGFYYKTNKNHLFAAPNKYYEHLFLGKPLLTTLDTPPGIKVEKFKTGWAIEEGVESISAFLDSITINKCKEFSVNALRLWDKDFKNYNEEHVDNYYIDKIREIYE